MILDYLFTIGQAASALLLVYGGYLVLVPARRKAPALSPRLEDELVLLKHMHTDA
jgi:hypothetical protein